MTTRKSHTWYSLFEELKLGQAFTISFGEVKEAEDLQDRIVRSSRKYAIAYNREFKGTCRILYLKKEVKFTRET
jgi:hypothetical protein